MNRYWITNGILEQSDVGGLVRWEEALKELACADDARRHAQAVGTELVQEKRDLQAQLAVANEKLKYHDLFKKWQVWRDPDELVAEYEKYQTATAENESLKQQVAQLREERDRLNGHYERAYGRAANAEKSLCDLHTAHTTLRGVVEKLPICHEQALENGQIETTSSFSSLYDALIPLLTYRATLPREGEAQEVGNGN